MIESAKAVERIDEIVAVDGIDAVCVGPADLSMSLGIFQRFDDERYRQAEATVREACRRHGKAMATGTYSLEHAAACREAGDPLVLALGDDQALQQTAAGTLAALR